MATRPIQINVVSALDKIGKTNGTAIPTTDSPASPSNSEAEAWHTERNAIFEILIAGQVKSYAEKRDEKAKDHIKMLFAETFADVVPSTSLAITRGDMSLSVERRKGREMLDEALLTSALAKRGIDLPVVEAVLKESRKTTAPALYLRASIISKD